MRNEKQHASSGDNGRVRLDWIEIERLAVVVLDQILRSDWRPTVIVAMSRGGFIPATQLAVELGVLDLVGIDVQKDKDGSRTISRFAALQNLDGQRVLIVDDGTVTGNLLQLTAEVVRTQGGDPRTCALVSEGKCDPPDYLAEIRDDISAFPWKR